MNVILSAIFHVNGSSAINSYRHRICSYRLQHLINKTRIQKSFLRTKSDDELKNYRKRLNRVNPLGILDRQSAKARANDGDNNETQHIHPKANKLSQGLEPAETKKLTDRAQGTADALCTEIAISLNNCLSGDKLYGTFKGFKVASDIIDIDRCDANLDFSDVTVYWSSSVVKKVLDAVADKSNEENAKRLSVKIIEGITKKLQMKEPVFRSVLMKDVYFKKVPKLIFKSSYETKKSKFSLTPEMIAELRGINN